MTKVTKYSAPYKPTQTSYTPLSAAVKTSKTPEVSRLLHEGIEDPNQMINGVPLLYHAVKNRDHATICVLLSDVRTDPNCAREAFPGFEWEAGDTPLCLAAAMGDLNMINLLMKMPHIDVNKAYNHQTPLHIAILRRQWHVVEALLKDPRVDIEAKCKIYTSIGLAALINEKPAIYLFLNHYVSLLVKDKTMICHIEKYLPLLKESQYKKYFIEKLRTEGNISRPNPFRFVFSQDKSSDKDLGLDYYRREKLVQAVEEKMSEKAGYFMRF